MANNSFFSKINTNWTYWIVLLVLWSFLIIPFSLYNSVFNVIGFAGESFIPELIIIIGLMVCSIGATVVYCITGEGGVFKVGNTFTEDNVVKWMAYAFLVIAIVLFAAVFSDYYVDPIKQVPAKWLR